MAREHGYSCIHPGIVEYKGHNYLFYLNEMLVGGTGSNRSVCVKEFEYDEDNLIVRETDEDKDAYMEQGIEDTTKGTSFFSVDPVDVLNPYLLNQAETICWQSNLGGATGGFNGTGRGVKTKAKEQCTEIDDVTGKEAFWKSAAMYGVVVCDIDNDDYIKVREVDFGANGAVSFKASIACGQGTPLEDPIVDDKGMEIFNPNADTVGGKLEVWVDYEDEDAKKLIGTIDVSDTGDTNAYKEFGFDINEPLTGKHDVYFIFSGEEDAKLFNFDTWQFQEKYVPPVATPTPVPAVSTVAPQPTATVTDNEAKTETVKLSKPKFKNIKSKKGKVTVTLSKVKKADGYQVCVSNKKKGKYKIVLKLKGSKTTGVIKSLKKKKIYYMKARAYANVNGKKVYSKYTSIKRVKVK